MIYYFFKNTTERCGARTLRALLAEFGYGLFIYIYIYACVLRKYADFKIFVL
jgi:hypothetical protein